MCVKGAAESFFFFYIFFFIFHFWNFCSCKYAFFISIDLSLQYLAASITVFHQVPSNVSVKVLLLAENRWCPISREPEEHDGGLAVTILLGPASCQRETPETRCTGLVLHAVSPQRESEREVEGSF